MKTSHHADGPGSAVLPGPEEIRISCARAFCMPAFCVNDNAPRQAAERAPATAVVLSTEIRDTGPLATIRLMGSGGELSAPVCATRDTAEIIALWRGLGRDLNLPLYLRDGRGVMTPITPRVGDIVHARRRGSALPHRRPRFLARRRGPLAPAPAAGDAGKTTRLR